MVSRGPVACQQRFVQSASGSGGGHLVPRNMCCHGPVSRGGAPFVLNILVGRGRGVGGTCPGAVGRSTMHTSHRARQAWVGELGGPFSRFAFPVVVLGQEPWGSRRLAMGVPIGGTFDLEVNAAEADVVAARPAYEQLVV